MVEIPTFYFGPVAGKTIDRAMRSLLLAMSMVFVLLGKGQTIALDFTEDDCLGTNHHLFEELDAGKIIILEFAMVACSPCIDAGHVLQDVLDAHELAEPGVVKWYAWGYSDTYDCTTMEQWETDNGFTPSATFANSPEQVAYYGGTGMPTIVVLAGADHQVLLLQHGYIPSTQSHVEAAIATGLTIGVEEQQSSSFSIRYDPVASSVTLIPLHNAVHIAGSLRLTIMDALGRAVCSKPVRMTEAVAVGGLAHGAYSMLVTDLSGTVVARSRFVRE